MGAPPPESAGRGESFKQAAAARESKAAEANERKRRAQILAERAAALAAQKPMPTSLPKSVVDSLKKHEEKRKYLEWREQLERKAGEREREKIKQELKQNPRSPDKPYIPYSRGGSGSRGVSTMDRFKQQEASERAAKAKLSRAASAPTRRPTTAPAATASSSSDDSPPLVIAISPTRPHHQMGTIGGYMGGPFNIIGVSMGGTQYGWGRRRGFTYLP